MRKILSHKYEVLRPIAEGGMGSIYLVKDLHANQLAVVKIQERRTDRTVTNTGKKEVCCEEIKILQSLSHPTLPKVLDYFEEDEKTYIVLEYVEGITLEQYLRTVGKVEWKQVVKWGIELSEVLAYLHERQPCIIYRDLKPANIMIEPGGRLKLIDFGAACMGEGKKEAGLAGTSGYGAPEQWEWGGACKESDIYALGMVLYEMLIGKKPFAGRKKIIHEFDKTHPAELQRIVIKCIQTRVAKRYHSAQKVQRKLIKLYRNNTQKRKNCIIWLGIVILLCGIWLTSFAMPLRKTEATEMQQLKVEMRDERYRKLLLKEGYAYQPKDALRFEIAKDNLPAGKMSLQIVVIDEEKIVYESRVFLVENN